MRIAISGTHYSGKSTLIKALLKELPGYEHFVEPYWILAEGHTFSDPPTIEEFEMQLDCSCDLITISFPNALFDRSPIDFLAYALVLAEENSIEFDIERWESQIVKALSLLDLVVFLPVENPDRIALPASEDKALRLLVDEKLRELIIEDAHELMKTKTVEVTGTLTERTKKILKEIKKEIK